MEFVQHYIAKTSTALQPHKELVAQTATLVTILQILSPLFIFNNMRKAKSTLGMPFMPFLIGVILTSLNIRFSQLLNDDAMFRANSVGFSVMVVYISIFFHYVSPREKFSHLMKILGAAAFIGFMIAYSKVEDSAKVETRFGFVLTFLMYCMFAMPVLDIKKTLTQKCTRHMPFPMILSGTLVGSCWFLHGIIINSGIVILQNFAMVGINLFQLSLFVIYPSEPISGSKKEKPKKKRE